MGKRMKSRGPKALFDLGNQTLIERQLDVLWHVFPNSDICVVIGFQADKVRLHIKEKYPVRLVYNPMWEQTGPLFSFSLGLMSCVTETVLLLHGDLLFNSEAIGGITERGSRALMDTEGSLKNEEVGLVYDKTSATITNFSYGLPSKWGQMVYLENAERQLLEAIAHNHGISQKQFLYEALNKVIEEGGKLRIHQPNGLRLIDIDTMKDLEKAKAQ
jgi:choline kinase